MGLFALFFKYVARPATGAAAEKVEGMGTSRSAAAMRFSSGKRWSCRKNMDRLHKIFISGTVFSAFCFALYCKKS